MHAVCLQYNVFANGVHFHVNLTYICVLCTRDERNSNFISVRFLKKTLIQFRLSLVRKTLFVSGIVVIILLIRSTLAAYQAANNVQVVYHRLQVCTRSSSILSGRNVHSCRCQQWPSFSPFCVTRRSDGALGKNVNVWTT